MREWARERGWSDADLDELTEEFIDYWRSCSVKATKLDWTLTWKTRVRDQERRRRPLRVLPTTTERVVDGLRIADRLRQEGL